MSEQEKYQAEKKAKEEENSKKSESAKTAEGEDEEEGEMKETDDIISKGIEQPKYKFVYSYPVDYSVIF